MKGLVLAPADCFLPPSPVQDEEYHEQTSDVRSQLRFFEQLERIEKQRKDEQEREILLKAAKVPELVLLGFFFFFSLSILMCGDVMSENTR